MYPGKANENLLSLFLSPQMIKEWIIKRVMGFTGSQKFLSVQLDITNKCNLNCRHCYQAEHSAQEDLGVEEWGRILGQYGDLAKKLHLIPDVCISGGEPTISPLFHRLLVEITSKWPTANILLLTNGTNLTEPIISDLVRYKVGIQISLDGPDPERHDQIRGYGNYEKTMNGLVRLQKAGLNAAFQGVLSARTAPWMNEFFSTAKAKNVVAMNFTRFVTQGKGTDLYNKGGDRPLIGAELKEAYLSMLSESKKADMPTATNIPLMALLASDLGAQGKFGFQGLVIDYKGNLKVSSRADYILGNILQSGIEELFLRHPIMERLREGAIEECNVCRFYDVCGGDRNASYAAYGTFFKKDPGCWL